MFPIGITIIKVTVTCICVYQTQISCALRPPCESDTARVKFTRLLTFYQFRDIWVFWAARCNCITYKPRGPAVDVRLNCSYTWITSSYKKAVLSQGEPRDAAVNFDTYRILQYVDNGTFMYAKHASDAKVSTKHFESRLEVIQGHTFLDEKPTILHHFRDIAGFCVHDPTPIPP